MLPFIGSFFIYKRKPRKKVVWKFKHFDESSVCPKCKFYVFSPCLCSFEDSIYHCKCGFSPYVSNAGDSCYGSVLDNLSLKQPKQLEFLFK